jgi:hypothetical protein
MGEQPFLEEFICKYACLWEAPNRTPYFKVNETVEGVFVQKVLFDNPFWENIKWDFYILKTIQGHGEVEILNIETLVSCSLRAQHTILHQFRGGEVSHPGG